TLKSRTLLIVSFGLLLAVLTSLIALGLMRIESFNSQVKELTGAQGRKIGTISEVFLSNGQRAAAIDRLFSAETEQARAGAHAHYRGAIDQFVAAVEKLGALPATGPEREARDDALVAAGQARDIGERIAGMLARGQTAVASELNLTQAVLADSRFQETLYL